MAQAARLLHLNPKRVQALARTGLLPGFRVGRKWLFRRQELDRMLAANRPAGAGEPETQRGEARDGAVELSARNQLRGVITALTLDGLMAEVRLAIGDQELVSVITRSSAERLGLAVGQRVLAVIKSTEVMIGRP